MTFDRGKITKLLGLGTPKRPITAWQWISKLQQRLRSYMRCAWLLVIDGADNVRDPNFRRFCADNLGSTGFVLLTSRSWGVTRTFLQAGGQEIVVEPLDPRHAAHLLILEKQHSLSANFDELARALDYSPEALLQAKAFIKTTRMPANAYLAALTDLANASNWREDSHFVWQTNIESSVRDSANRLLATEEIATLSICGVLQNSVTSSWTGVFEHIENTQTHAGELLSTLSVLGLVEVPNAVLPDVGEISTATSVLLDHCLLQKLASDEPTTYCASGLMMLSRRVWLLRHGRLAMAFQSALHLVSSIYPEASVETFTACADLEQAAENILHCTDGSWIRGDVNSRWHRSMLCFKRSNYLKLAGVDTVRAEELRRAGVQELAFVHNVGT